MTRAKHFDPTTIPEPVRALQETLLGHKLTAKDVEIARTSAKQYDPDDPKTEERPAKLWQPPALSAEHRQAIATALKGRNVDLDRVYHLLEAKIDIFRKMQQMFPGKQPERPKRLEEWKRVYKLSLDLIHALHAADNDAYRQIPWGRTEMVDPQWLPRVVGALAEIKEEAETQLSWNRFFGKGFAGTQDRWRKYLYASVLDIWTDVVRGDVTYSRPTKRGKAGRSGAPSGDLIRFFLACVTPVLGDDTPSVYGVAAIIDRRRGKRRRLVRGLTL
jgi:hypothetical protein